MSNVRQKELLLHDRCICAVGLITLMQLNAFAEKVAWIQNKTSMPARLKFAVIHEKAEPI